MASKRRAGVAGTAAAILDGGCARRSAGRQVGTKEWCCGRTKEWGLGSSFCWRLGVIWIEQDLAFEQRAQHVEQAIGNATQRARMIVAPHAQRRIPLAGWGLAGSCWMATRAQ